MKNTPNDQGEDNTPSRVIQTAIQVAVAGIPYIGAPLHAAVFGTLHDRRLRRLEEFTRELGTRLETLAQDPAFVENLTALLQRSERFVVFLRECLQRVHEEYDKEKFRAYKEAFIQGITNTCVSVDTKLQFLKLLDRMSPVELAVMGLLCREVDEHCVPVSAIITALSDGSDLQSLLYLSATDTLANMQLIQIYHIDIDEEDILHREKHDYRLTSLGREFAQFISIYPKMDAQEQA